MSREKSLLVISKILRIVVNTFTADERYSVLTRDDLTQPIHMHISQKQKTYSGIFLLKSILNFEHLRQKKMTLIAYVFPKLQTPESVVR